MATVGVVTFELRIDHAASLKDKRQVVKSLKDRLRSRFNIAVAEIDFQDIWQRAIITAVTVSSSKEQAAETLQRVEEEASSVLGAMLVRADVEWL